MSPGRVLVTIRGPRGEGEVDLDLPTGVPIQELLPLVLDGVGWSAESLQWKATPPGRVLAGFETLETAHVYDGAVLDLVKESRAAPPPLSSVPGGGWGNPVSPPSNADAHISTGKSIRWQRPAPKPPDPPEQRVSPAEEDSPPSGGWKLGGRR